MAQAVLEKETVACNPQSLLRSVIGEYQRDTTPRQDAALTHLELAEETLCPMAIGKAVEILSSEWTPKPCRIIPRNRNTIDILQEARRQVFLQENVEDFPPDSKLQFTFATLASVDWPMAGSLGIAYRHEMQIFAVLWANAKNVNDLTTGGVHYREIAGQVGMEHRELHRHITRMRKYGFLTAGDGSGMVRMSPRIVEHFLSQGVSEPGKIG